MRVLFLGTGAAEGYPAVFCECAHCTTARARGGRNLRRRSALLVNDDLLIDMGPDLVASMHATGANFGRVATLLITHAHGDHFHLPNLYMRRSNFCATTPAQMDVYGTPPTMEAINTAANERNLSAEEFHLLLNTIRPGDAWQAGRSSTHPTPAPFPTKPGGNSKVSASIARLSSRHWASVRRAPSISLCSNAPNTIKGWKMRACCRPTRGATPRTFPITGRHPIWNA